MSGSPAPGSPPPPPPTPPQDDVLGQRGEARAGSDFVLLVFEVLLAIFLAYALILTPLYVAFSTTPDSLSAGESAVAAGFGLVFAQFIFQAVQGLFPWLVEHRRGRTLTERLRFEFKFPIDLGAGFVLAFLCSLGAYLAQTITSAAVGLENSDEASNTGIITDNEGSLWLIGLIVLIVIGAPLVEELLFRGLLLRSIEKIFGTTAGIIGSSILFMVPHVQADVTWQATVVLWSALLVVGIILAIGAVMLGRIGPTIIAHLLFNGVGVIGALAATT